jgi:lipopolysaccharide export system permease protein
MLQLGLRIVDRPIVAAAKAHASIDRFTLTLASRVHYPPGLSTRISSATANRAAMFILPRYLLRQFLQVFAICFLSLTGLYIVIDAFGHLDHFSTFAEKGGGSLFEIMGAYYAYHSLAFFDGTSGILAMISAMFTVAWLQRHQELTAIMAAGISKLRILKPLLLAAVGVSLLGVANRELLIPQVRDELTRDTKDLGGSNARDLEARFDRSNILIGGEKVVLAERQIIKPAFVLPTELSRYGRQLAAANGYYTDANEQHPSGFVLSGVTTPSNLTRSPSLVVDDQPVILTPADAPWLGSDEVFVASDLPFPLLASGSNWRRYASASELISGLHSPGADMGADVRVTVHARMVQPLMDGTLLMLGLPLMLSRRNRNVFLSIGICLAVATAFTLVALACQSLGSASMMRPSLAAWLPLMMFVPVAAAMSQALRT